MNQEPEGIRPGFQRLIYPNRDLSQQVRHFRKKIIDNTLFNSGYSQTTWREDLALLKQRGDLTTSSQIAYLGCGDDIEVQEALPDTTNVDIREQDPLLKNFLLADATNLPFKDESFDGVILKAFGGLPSVYAEAERILKPEGIVLVVQNLRPMDYDHIPDETETPLPLTYLSIQNQNLTTLRTLGESGLGLVEPLSYQATITKKGVITSAEKAEIEQLMNRNRKHLIHLLETRDWENIHETPKIKTARMGIKIVRLLIQRFQDGRIRSAIPELLDALKKVKTNEIEIKGRISGIVRTLKGNLLAERYQDVIPELLETIEEHKDLISPKARAKIFLEIAQFEKHFAHEIEKEEV